MEHLFHGIIEFVHKMGMPGIFIATFLESTFVPIPSEATMIPAGYLVYQGKMSLLEVAFFSMTGMLSGSLVNYYIARFLGRPFIVRFQKYFLLNDTKIYKIEAFFNHHGEVSTLTGRFIPLLRHFISFPAGLARMDARLFSLYTAIGGGLWMAALLAVGYFLGDKEMVWKEYVPKVVAGGVALAVLTVVGYVLYVRRINAKDEGTGEVRETLKELTPHHIPPAFKHPTEKR